MRALASGVRPISFKVNCPLPELQPPHDNQDFHNIVNSSLLHRIPDLKIWMGVGRCDTDISSTTQLVLVRLDGWAATT